MAVKRLEVSRPGRVGYALYVEPLPGAPYNTHNLYVGGQLVASRLSPYSQAEIDAFVREHSLMMPRSSTQEIGARPSPRYGRNRDHPPTTKGSK